MTRRTGVYFTCVTCQWRHDVPEEHVVLVGGMPRSDYVPLHTCPSGEPDIEERGYFEPAAVRGLVARHAAGTCDHSQEIWALLCLEQWHRTYLDPAAPPSDPPGAPPWARRAEGNPRSVVAQPA